MAETIRWGLSVDSAGVTGPFEMSYFLYKPAIAAHPEGFVGFEVFPWLSRKYTWSVIKKAEALRVQIASIHGQTGGVHEAYGLRNRAIMTVLNWGMVDTCELIREFGQKVPRILVHTPVIHSKDVRDLLYQQPKLVKCLAVENHVHFGATGSALEAALMLKNMGVNTEVVFDLFHCWSANNHLPDDKRWNEVCRQNKMLLDAAAAYGFKVSYHVPIGPGGDGLPSEFITDISYGRYWRQLAKALEQAEKSGLVGTRTIENQQKFWQAIVVYGAVFQQRAWNKQVVKVLASEGII